MARMHYDKELDKLNEEVLTMGIRVREVVQNAVDSLIKKDFSMAEKIINGDDIINQAELDIQDRCTMIIATEQPVAGDLRHIVTILKVVTQLERIGDYAVHIGKATINLKDETYLDSLKVMQEMAIKGLSMLDRMLTAFTDCNEDAARSIAAEDKQIDGMYDRVVRDLLKEMAKDSEAINQGTTLMFICRFLERLGDHVVNIGEWVVYNATGNHAELG